MSSSMITVRFIRMNSTEGLELFGWEEKDMGYSLARAVAIALASKDVTKFSKLSSAAGSE